MPLHSLQWKTASLSGDVSFFFFFRLQNMQIGASLYCLYLVVVAAAVVVVVVVVAVAAAAMMAAGWCLCVCVCASGGGGSRCRFARCHGRGRTVKWQRQQQHAINYAQYSTTRINTESVVMAFMAMIRDRLTSWPRATKRLAPWGGSGGVRSSFTPKLRSPGPVSPEPRRPAQLHNVDLLLTAAYLFVVILPYALSLVGSAARTRRCFTTMKQTIAQPL